MRKTFKFRLYPNKKQKESLERTLESCRSLYNESIEERKQAWEFDGFGITYIDQQNDLPAKKEENPNLDGIHSQVLQDVCRRVDKAYKAFFRRVKNGEKPGYPRFKSYGRYDSFTYPQDGFRPMSSGRIRLSKIGEVKMKRHRPIEGIIKTCTVKKSPTGKWHVSFSCDNVPQNRLPKSDSSVGIDVGLQYFAVLSTGEKINNPRFFREAERRLRVANRSVSRKKKGSNRRRKAVRAVAVLHERTSNKRNDFADKTARRIVNQFGTIIVEDLNVRNMVKNRFLSKSIQDASWSMFFQKLSCKAEEAGRNFVKVNPRGTSQTCLCGAVVKKKLSDRWHECPSCGLSEQRDLVSAKLIHRLGLSLREPSRAVA